MIELSFKTAAYLAALVAPASFLAFRYLFRQLTSLRGKVVIVTGASSGIGESCVHEFFKLGCKVVLCARNTEKLEQVKTELMSLSTKYKNENEPFVVKLDLGDAKSISSAVEKINENYPDGIHILINNAGITVRGDIKSTTMDVYRKIMEVNYFGQICLTKSLLPSMTKLPSESNSRIKAHVITVNSLHGKLSAPNRSAYVASKHACVGFYECLTSEVAADGINVCIVYPAYVQTNISLNALTGSGTNHGVMDKETAAGFEPSYIAKEIIDAVLKEKQNIVMTNNMLQVVGIWMRLLCPSLYFWYMKKKAKKS